MRSNLKLLRIKNNLTQEQMAELINCNRTTYSDVESGKRNPRNELWENLQKSFDISDSEMWSFMKNE